jgi:hypothetical protein
MFIVACSLQTASSWSHVRLSTVKLCLPAGDGSEAAESKSGLSARWKTCHRVTGRSRSLLKKKPRSFNFSTGCRLCEASVQLFSCGVLFCAKSPSVDKHQIAFGTAFYPKDPAKLFAFVTELLDSGVPFLWSHASPFAKLPEDLAARIDDSALAHHANWVPQRAVLGHPATMWFVSHGRWNSVQEALGLRVPL